LPEFEKKSNKRSVWKTFIPEQLRMSSSVFRMASEKKILKMGWATFAAIFSQTHPATLNFFRKIEQKKGRKRSNFGLTCANTSA
jgi:hypothetical protein